MDSVDPTNTKSDHPQSPGCHQAPLLHAAAGWSEHGGPCRVLLCSSRRHAAAACRLSSSSCSTDRMCTVWTVCTNSPAAQHHQPPSQCQGCHAGSPDVSPWLGHVTSPRPRKLPAVQPARVCTFQGRVMLWTQGIPSPCICNSTQLLSTGGQRVVTRQSHTQ